MTGYLEGKRGLILGVANKWSIAWAIARATSDAGASLMVTYQNERLARQVNKLVETLPRATTIECDVTREEQLEALRKAIEDQMGTIHFVVHSIAFAYREDLEGPFYEVPRDHFLTAMDISAYSLVSVVRAVRPVLETPASVLAMTYLGGERVVPHYNVMGVAKAALDAIVRYLASDLGPEGIRVNAISAGPIKTLAAAGIKDFSKILDVYENRSPLRRNIRQDDVARVAVFLLSDAAAGITGSTVYVDAGYHIMAV